MDIQNEPGNGENNALDAGNELRHRRQRAPDNDGNEGIAADHDADNVVGEEERAEENAEVPRRTLFQRCTSVCFCCCRGRQRAEGEDGDVGANNDAITSTDRPKCCSTWMKYSLASFVAAVVMIHHAFETKKQFYPAVIYLVTSKPCISVLGNFAFVLLISTAKLFQSAMLGSLYPLEVERASEILRFSVLDTCLALTLFREDLSYKVITLFALLLLSKFFHVLADARMDSHEQHDSRIAMMGEPEVQDRRHTTCGHICFVLLLMTLFVLDLCLTFGFSYRVAEEGPSVAILFAFEYILMLLSVILVAYRYLLYHAAHRIEMRTEGSWVNKNLYLMYGRLFVSMIKLLVLLTYFTILTAFITFPIMMARDLFQAFRSVKVELQNLVATRRLRRQITERFMRPTQEEIDESGGVDIISHLDLQPETSIKLPCNHIFREDALLSWWERQQTCPICRYDVNQPEPEEYVRERERRRHPSNIQTGEQQEQGQAQAQVHAPTDDAPAAPQADVPEQAQPQPNQQQQDLATVPRDREPATTVPSSRFTTNNQVSSVTDSMAETKSSTHQQSRVGDRSPIQGQETQKPRRHKKEKKRSKKSKRRRRKHRRRVSSSDSSSSSSFYDGMPWDPNSFPYMPFMPPPPPPEILYQMGYMQQRRMHTMQPGSGDHGGQSYAVPATSAQMHGMHSNSGVFGERPEGYQSGNPSTRESQDQSHPNHYQSPYGYPYGPMPPYFGFSFLHGSPNPSARDFPGRSYQSQQQSPYGYPHGAVPPYFGSPPFVPPPAWYPPQMMSSFASTSGPGTPHTSSNWGGLAQVSRDTELPQSDFGTMDASNDIASTSPAISAAHGSSRVVISPGMSGEPVFSSTCGATSTSETTSPNSEEEIRRRRLQRLSSPQSGNDEGKQ